MGMIQWKDVSTKWRLSGHNELMQSLAQCSKGIHRLKVYVKLIFFIKSVALSGVM